MNRNIIMDSYRTHNCTLIYRSSWQRCSVRKGVLINFAKFTGKHLCQSLFFNKVAGLRSATLLKKRLWHRYFPMNFVKFLKTSFLQNTSGRLPLVIPDIKEIKDKLNDSENRSRRNNLGLMRLLRKKTSHGHKVRRNYRKSLKIHCSLNGTLKLNVHTVVEKQ